MAASIDRAGVNDIRTPALSRSGRMVYIGGIFIKCNKCGHNITRSVFLIYGNVCPDCARKKPGVPDKLTGKSRH